MKPDGNRPFLSVIIPYYNTPIEYLKRAVDSINCSDRSKVEIIIIDDGSKPENAIKVDAEFNIYKNVDVYHKENGGFSSARNYGIKQSKGEYITFVDDDDWVSDKFISEAYEYIKDVKYEIIICNMKLVPIDTNDLRPQQEFFFQNGNKIEIYRCLTQVKPRKYDFVVSGSVCGNIYKSDNVRQVLFDENVEILEDQLFNRIILYKANKVVIVPQYWYFYYQRDGSTMHPDDKEIIYEKMKTYIDALGRLFSTAPYDIQVMYSTEIFGKLDGYAHELAIKNNESFSNKIRKLKQYSQISAVKNSLSILKKDRRYLNLKKRILLKVFLWRQYGVALVLKKLADRFG